LSSGGEWRLDDRKVAETVTASPDDEGLQPLRCCSSLAGIDRQLVVGTTSSPACDSFGLY